MRKEQLKSLLNEMCDNLLNSIEESADEITKEKITNLLHEAAYIINNMSDEDIKDKSLAKSIFTNAYKEIANQSLDSYENTNNKFEELNKMHQKILKSCDNENRKLPLVIDKLNHIGNLMTDEIYNANKAIHQLKDQVKNLESKSNLDALTKIYNRRALITYLNNICDKRKLFKDLYLLIIDIDDFKKVNDTYGHIAGDKVLIFLSNIFKSTLRDGDKVFRYGGEEFIITLNRINDKECQIISQKLLNLVSKNKLIYKGENLNVTISIGATNHILGDTPDSIVARADKALYKSKSSGKNQMFMEITNGI